MSNLAAPADTSNNVHNEWERIAARRIPQQLHTISKSSLATHLSTVLFKSQNSSIQVLQGICELLKSEISSNVRTELLRSNELSNNVTNPSQIGDLLLLQLLSNIQHVMVKPSNNNTLAQLMHLDKEQCEKILSGLNDIDELHIESLHLEGITMESGVITEILNKTKTLRSLHISGDVAKEVLLYLGSPKGQSLQLQGLYLTSCDVTDNEVVSGILGSTNDIIQLGSSICNENKEENIIMEGLSSLLSLTVKSPHLTLCGSLILLHYLPKLQKFDFTSWNSSVSDSLLFLKKISPKNDNFQLKSMDILQLSPGVLETLGDLCPDLHHISMDCTPNSPTDMNGLSKFKNLSSLKLRMFSEELILLAVNTIGPNLNKLVIEFEEYSHKQISWSCIQQIQEFCPNLEFLKIRNADISDGVAKHSGLRYTIDISKDQYFPQLRYLALDNVIIQPKLLPGIIVGNHELRFVELNLHKSNVTDEIFQNLMKNNNFNKLDSISFGSSKITEKTITSLLSLQKLRKMTLCCASTTSISDEKYSMLQEKLVKGNYQCILENILTES
ncbi:unnamed protein product [Meganyctiphanes norvegica]|uniref:Uncharacterized protein n=1 Tax=Meganyctiphanes norvegica TaxID=48144 RepID=A0AAV2R7T2_MEGNR